MECTGAAQDLSIDELRNARAYLLGRVKGWKLLANGERWQMFDTAVLTMCLATLADLDDYLARFATPVISA